ncbi:MAG: hypothetical protein CMO12_01915 [Thaumarchaeota archaeon]|jgi:4-hydroxy-3-polyprenylbenzoate decarboxylase|nr:hypothetical protein [Nitrososphaerota archaeon]
MRYYKNLEDFINVLDQEGLLVRIKRPIVKETELVPLVRLQYRGLPETQRKGFLFEKVVGVKGQEFNAQVAVGILASSAQIYALGMRCSTKEINNKWSEAQLHPIEPVIVDSGPVYEEIHVGNDLEKLGLNELPVPVSTPGFAGTLRTTTQYITKDPESGARNTGDYSGHLRSNTTLAFGVNPGQHAYLHWTKSKEKGVPLEAAIIIGSTPNIAYAAGVRLPYGVDELAVAGGIAGEPVELVKCKTIGLEVPANAEYVIEGKVGIDYLEPTPAFGEHTGFMFKGERGDPIMTVTCIAHRKRPIYQHILSQMAPSESSTMKRIGSTGVYHKYLKHDSNIPSITDVAVYEMSGVRHFCVIQMKKTHPAQPKQALHSLSGYDPRIGKVIIVVDDDIDPHDPQSVIWALSYRMQPHRDIEIITGKVPLLDPSAVPPGTPREEALFPPPSGTSALLIDATTKWPYPPVALPKKEFVDHALEIWKEEGLPELDLKTPWHGYDLGSWTKDDEENADFIISGDYHRVGEKLAKKQTTI